MTTPISSGVPAHNRFTFSGIFGTVIAPVEIWSCSIKTRPESFGTLANRQARVDAARTVWMNTLQGVLPPTAITTRVRLSEHLTGGLVAQDGEGTYKQADSVGDGPGGGSGGPTMPLQTALVVSLVTGRAGPTGKGRFFLPWPSKGLDPTFVLSETDRDLLQSVAASFVRGIGSLASPATAGDDVVVASSKGYLSPVTGVRVGRVPDTMRSRRNQLLEAFDPPTAL